MPRRKTQPKEATVSVERPLSKKPRGRPRKNPITIPPQEKFQSLTQLYDPELINFIRDGMSLMKIKTYREALE